MTAWDLNRIALREHLATDSLTDFLNWSTIEKTMFVGDVDFVRKEFEEMLVNNHTLDYETYHKVDNALYETKIGNPKLLWGWTSGNLIHQLYHLKQWLDRSKQDISELSSIVEIGAGYGAMCLICRRLGFEGLYIIFDLPELKTIQEYYLTKTVGTKNLLWLEFIDYQLPSSFPYCDLFIACHSLSEMPLSERERLLSQVEANAYLFASSYEFEGVDNDTWLKEFASSKVGYEWNQYAHPYQENALYSVGAKNELAK